MSHQRIRSPGKTNFLRFMLARLLSNQQVVVLCDNDQVHLFYRDQVYARPTALGFVDLPVHREHPSRSVWGLIDVDFQDHGPPISSDLTVWPIQASSEKPIRWRSWQKQLRGAALWGMPLWNLEELVEGYALSSFYRSSRGSSLTLVHLCSLSLSPDYDTLRSILEEYLPHLDRLTAPKTGDSRVDAILEVLHRERERERVAAVAVAAVEEEEEEEEAVGDYLGKLKDNTRAPAMDQGEVSQVDQAEQPQVPVYTMERALTILVRIATEEFGFIPRDVYRGILDLPEMRRDHTITSGHVDYSRLKELIIAFACDGELGPASQHVVVVFPTENWTASDLWDIDFKSIRVAEDAAEVMRRTTDQDMWKAYNTIHRLPYGSDALAGRIFEEIAHRVFCERSTLLCHPMISEGAEPPTFLTSTGPLSLHLSRFPGGRVHTRVDFKSMLSNVTLDSNRYYVPIASDHPLFDSFAIDAHSRPVVISVFQITVAPKCKGSAEGYLHIRRLKAHVRKLLKGVGYVRPPCIKVQYFLVCPDDGSERRWEMPAGWGEGSKGSHRGDVFCIRVRPPV